MVFSCPTVVMKIDLFIDYLQHERRYSSHTIRSYQNDLLQLRDFLGDRIPSNQESWIKALRLWISSMKHDGYSSTSIHRKLSSVSSYFRFGIRRGFWAHNPAKLLIKPKKAKKLPQYVQEEDLNFQFDSLNDDSFDHYSIALARIILFLLYHLGLRRSELLTLSDADIDWSGKLLRVKGKGNKTRLLPLGQEILEELNNFIRCRNDFFRTSDFKKLLLTNRGADIYPQLVYRTVKKFLMECHTAQKLSPHVLRHSFATHMMNRGAELHALKEIMGHSSLAATQIYTHTSVQQLKEDYLKAHPRSGSEK